MDFFFHQDGKTVYGLTEGTTVLGRRNDGTVYTLKVVAADQQKALQRGTYVVQRNLDLLDLTELTITDMDDGTTDDVALVIISAPNGAVEQILGGEPTEVLRLTDDSDDDSWSILVLEMTAGQRVGIITRANSSEIIDFEKDLLRSMRKTAVI